MDRNVTDVAQPLSDQMATERRPRHALPSHGRQHHNDVDEDGLFIDLLLHDVPSDRALSWN